MKQNKSMLSAHPNAGDDVWIGNKERTVLEVTDLWVYYRITGKGRTNRCRKSTWKSWCIRYDSYVSNAV